MPKTIDDRILTAVAVATRRIESFKSTRPEGYTDQQLIVHFLSRAIQQQISAHFEIERNEISRNRLTQYVDAPEQEPAEKRPYRHLNDDVRASVTKYVTKAINHRKITTLEDFEASCDKADKKNLPLRLVEVFEKMISKARTVEPASLKEEPLAVEPISTATTAPKARTPRRKRYEKQKDEQQHSSQDQEPKLLKHRSNKANHHVSAEPSSDNVPHNGGIHSQKIKKETDSSGKSGSGKKESKGSITPERFSATGSNGHANVTVRKKHTTVVAL